MDLETAKKKFSELVEDVKESSRSSFLSWIEEVFINNKEKEEVEMLKIAEIIRNKLPEDAVASSEEIFVPKSSEGDAKKALTVDNFLYDDDYINDLVDAGKFSRNYCLDCGSNKTTPFDFISHSSSVDELIPIFQKMFPDMKKKTFVDVGSRLGVVLYSCFYYSECDDIIGIEMNKDLCKIQNEICEQFQMNNRVSIINKNVMKCSDILQRANIIFFNNVFEYFTQPDQLADIWKFIMECISKKGQIIISYPSLSESFERFQMDSSLDEWVELIEDYQEVTDFFVYIVK